MNARTSRLLRRVALAVHVAEYRVAAMQPAEKRPRVPSEAMQLASLKQAWHRTPRPQRYATRVRLVGIFNEIVTGTPA